MCSTPDWSYMTPKSTSWHEKNGGTRASLFLDIFQVLDIYYLITKLLYIYIYISYLFLFDVFWALLDF